MIILSLLDTDLYKFTMMNMVFKYFPNVQVEYEFHIRNKGVDLRPYKEKIEKEIDQLCSLTLKDDELLFLKNLNYFSDNFIAFLKDFKLNRSHVITNNKDKFQLIIKGSWLETILFEVPLLSIINECYFSDKKISAWDINGKKKIYEKINYLKLSPFQHLKFSDFGTRRRFSKEWQYQVIKILKDVVPNHIAGTSNIFLAKEFHLPAIGTMAHEYIQSFQVLAPNIESSQQFAFELWIKEYGQKLGVALSDTYGLNAFLKDFRKDLATDYHGIRHDSGDPFHWGERVIKHYETLQINPKEKLLVFSNSLTIPLAIQLYEKFYSRINVAFGIGTNLTNDVGHKPLEIVIKMVECNGKPVAKISDDKGKTICRNEEYLVFLKSIFK